MFVKDGLFTRKISGKECENQEIFAEIYIEQKKGKKFITLDLRSCKIGSIICASKTKVLDSLTFEQDRKHTSTKFIKISKILLHRIFSDLNINLAEFKISNFINFILSVVKNPKDVKELINLSQKLLRKIFEKVENSTYF